MRKRIYLFGGTVLAICILLVLFWMVKRESPAPLETQEFITNQPLQPERSETLQPPQAPEPPKNANVPKVVNVLPRRSATELSNVLYQQMQADWRKSIEFYGRVVDENSNAVAGVSIQFRWADMTEDVNTSAAQSDIEGLFSLHGKLGRSLHVWVSKDGYYSSHGGEESFLYSLGPDIYSPDPSNPVIFRLHRKGQGAELVTSENGVRLKVDVRVPRDDTPVRVDLWQKRSGAGGQLEISQVKPSWQNATN